MFMEFLFDKTIPTGLLCHQHAFESLGSVPKLIVLDKLKATILQAYTLDRDPQVTRTYAECGEH
jgi:transposase